MNFYFFKYKGYVHIFKSFAACFLYAVFLIVYIPFLVQCIVKK